MKPDFENFSKSCSCFGEVVWTFYEDYVWYSQILYVNANKLLWNRNLARRICKDELRFPFGVELRLIALCDGLAFCTVYAPREAVDAQSLMITDVKLFVPDRLPDCRLVVDIAMWDKLVLQQRRQRNQLPSLVEDIMRKSDIDS